MGVFSQLHNMKMKIPLMLASLILSMTSVSSEDADLWIKELRVKTGYEHNAGMDGCCVRFVIYNKESGVCVTNNVDPPGEDMEAGQLDIIGADGGLGSVTALPPQLPMMAGRLRSSTRTAMAGFQSTSKL